MARVLGDQKLPPPRQEERILVKYLRHVVAAAAILSLPAISAIADSRDRTSDSAVMGYVENVYVGKLGLEMKGKLDTGAEVGTES